MRRFFSLTFVCAIAACASFASAQEIDIAAGGGTIFSAKPTSSSQAFPPPALKGGVYPSFSAQYMRWDRFGLKAEIAVRAKQALYDGYQNFRPALYNIDGVYATSVGAKTTADVTAGIGGETIIFYNHYNACTSNSGVCSQSVNSTHFAANVGLDFRYNVWRHYFVGPEAHLYHVFNNTQFHSGNLFRAGVIIGYTFGR